MNIDTVIFDMDGLLVNSGPLWKQAEKEILEPLGVTFSLALMPQTSGMTTAQVTEYWYQLFPWQGESCAEVTGRLVKRVVELAWQADSSVAMPGVEHALSICEQQQWQIGLASNAPIEVINAFTECLNLKHRFNGLVSAEAVAQGKPHPAVYQHALALLQADARNTIAFEDSVAGMQAAQGAGIATIVVPAPGDYDNPQFEDADYKLASLHDFTVANF